MTRSRKRGSKGMPLWLALVILAAMAAIGAAWWLMIHLAALAGFAVILSAAFYVGRRYERRRAVGPQPAPKARVTPAPNPAADQIAHLEQLAARPISAIIASYETIQRRYGGRS